MQSKIDPNVRSIALHALSFASTALSVLFATEIGKDKSILVS